MKLKITGHENNGIYHNAGVSRGPYSMEEELGAGRILLLLLSSVDLA